MRVLNPRAEVGGRVASRAIMPEIQRPTFMPSSITSPCSEATAACPSAEAVFWGSGAVAIVRSRRVASLGRSAPEVGGTGAKGTDAKARGARGAREEAVTGPGTGALG
jgi:hypothetical protein